MSVTKVVLAKLSPTMEEGTIVKWTKKEGDAIKVGDVLAEIETDKANMEMEAMGTGVLRKILVQAGGKAPVGALIGVIADPADDIAPMLATAAPQAAAPAAAPAPATPAPAAAAPAPAAPAAAPSPKPAAPAPAPAPAAAPAEPGERVKASPLARSIASQQNLPLHQIAGSGPGGRIVKKDVEAYAAAPRPIAAAPSAKAPAGPPVPTITPGEEIPLTNMRKTIAKRLSESMFGAPHFYVTVEIDMGAAVSLRAQLLAGENVKISFNDLVLKACARALTRFPVVNSSWGGDKIVTHADVHIGVAVALPEGLIVPVVRNADRKSVSEISAEVKTLAGKARDKKLKPEEFMGSTFSVSNLGMFDVTEFTAIINPPESAILAVGSVRELAVVKDGRIEAGQRMKVTLSSDHRVIDGALAAQFLAEVRRLLENPISLIL
jgi:pyruvate dehydrogenase E2 component (dihydrolipoamide acetyltransferase)